MRDRMERFVLLPFTTGCISESSIAVGMQQAKRSKMDTHLTPTRTREVEKDEYEEDYEGDVESLSGESLKSPSNLSTLPRFQKLLKNFKNLSQLFAYKDEELENEESEEIRMEIGLPTDVKHVTHIGLDGCASSILSKGWNNLVAGEAAAGDIMMIDHASYPLSPLELAMAAQAEKPTVRSLLEMK